MHSIYGLWKYIHLRDTQPEIIDRTATITSQGGYLAYQLTGENVCSKSSASANGFLNVHTLEWDEHALTFAGITVDKLPKLCEASDVFSLSKKAGKAARSSRRHPRYHRRRRRSTQSAWFQCYQERNHDFFYGYQRRYPPFSKVRNYKRHKPMVLLLDRGDKAYRRCNFRRRKLCKLV